MHKQKVIAAVDQSLEVLGLAAQLANDPIRCHGLPSDANFKALNVVLQFASKKITFINTYFQSHRSHVCIVKW